MPRTESAQPSSPTGTLAAVACITLAIVAAYWNSLDGAFLFDDFDSITENPHIRTLWPLSEAMSRPLRATADTVSTRPVLSLTFALNQALLGREAVGYHAVNIGIHVCVALGLFAVVRRTIRSAPGLAPARGDATSIAAAIALLWGVHPLLTSSVTYIVQRGEALAAGAVLAAVYAMQRSLSSPRPGVWQFAIVACSAAGMGCKETAAAIPLLVWLYDALFSSGGFKAALRRRPRLYVALALTWLVLLLLLAPDTGDLVAGARAVEYARTQPAVILYYLRLAFWPDPLVMSYGWPASSWGAAVLPALVVTTAVVATLVGLRARHWSAFPAAAFFLLLAPSSSIFALAQRIMEHRMYLPLASVVIGVVSVSLALLRSVPPARRRAVAYLSIATIAAALAIRTHDRNRDYHDPIAFWRDNLEHRPGDVRASQQLARALTAAGRTDEAEPLFRHVARATPGDWKALNDLALAELELGRLDHAATSLVRALTIRPDYAYGWNNLGIVEERRGNPAGAARNFHRALAIDPDYAVAQSNLLRVTGGRNHPTVAPRGPGPSGAATGRPRIVDDGAR